MAQSSDSEAQFNKAFEKAVEKTLQELGSSVQTAVLYHLEKVQGLSTDEILKNPKVFSIALGKIFASGSIIIEDKIIRIMCRDLGVEYEKNQGTLEHKLSLVKNASSRRTALILN